MFGLPFPKVRAQFSDAAGVAGFDMNYIPGQTIAHAVVNGSTFDPATVAKAVERLMRLFAMTAGAALEATLFEAKIHEVAQRMETLVATPALDRKIRRCAQALLELNWGRIPESPCHGDLTLENILLTTGKSVAFIDCDMPFASSWWLDLGKLFQDIRGHWCIRALYESGEGIRLLNASQKLDQLGVLFHALALEMDSALPARLPQLAALGLYRALPYAQSGSTQHFLCERITHVLGAHDAAAR
jgi:aminoglycoside phosphotransferase (APT) family kinase protein